MSSQVPSLQVQLRSLRLRQAFGEARALIRTEPGFTNSLQLQALFHEHQDFWWSPIEGRRVALRRRNPKDLKFVRACWADSDFMRKFNRSARQLPQDDAVLLQTLAREYAGIFSETRALHWTIHASAGPIGFVSATEYSYAHRRCEFLVGVLRQPPSWASMEAAYLALEFLRARAGIERLTAYFYAENKYAARVAQKFGFEHEGVLKGYIRNTDGSRSDLLVAGMSLTGACKSAKTRDRLISGQ
jgi:[ribosomal protein S5]-alanine N-acetyltransferase